MFTEISQFEPLYPSRTGQLEDLAREVVASSARLEGRLAPETLEGVIELLRVVNSYYSNLIEGHSTHPIDIERAMRRDYSADAEKRDLQIESRIHIDVQKKISALLSDDLETNVTSPEFLRWIHREFYREVPESLRWVKGDNLEPAWVEAGEIRDAYVIVGDHVPPAADALRKFLKRFDEFYNPAKMHGLRPIVALSAAHHRLMWIHPFLDGNGRVTRLFTDAYFRRIKLSGYGLWNVSRGLARRRDEYKRFLAAADSERENDFDGRGNLSDRRLTKFCRFFLEICLDQTEFMNNLLALGALLERLEKYVSLRNAGLIVGEKGEKLIPLKPKVAEVLKRVAVRGEISRGEVFQIIEMSERTGRTILKGLLDEGLLTSKLEKGALRLGFPAAAAGYWLPDLYPTETRK